MKETIGNDRNHQGTKDQILSRVHISFPVPLTEAFPMRNSHCNLIITVPIYQETIKRAHQQIISMLI